MNQRFFEENTFTSKQIADIRQADTLDSTSGLKKALQHAIDMRDQHETGTILLQGLQNYGPVCPLVLMHSCYEQVCNLYRKLDIDESIRLATLSDIGLWTDVYAQTHQQQTGFAQVFWIARHLCANILRLGRLQFEPGAMKAPFRICRLVKTGELVTLADSNLACDQFGYLTDAEHARFTTTFSEDAASMCGHAVDTERGCIAPLPSSYKKDAVQCIADSSTEVLHLHIPSGERLCPDAVEAALSQARIRFPAYSVAACTSWLLDPALKQIAGPTSNIVGFMQRFSKFPVPLQTPQIFERVFGFTATEDDIPRWKATTTLQRSIQQALSEGVVFRTMGGYFLLR